MGNMYHLDKSNELITAQLETGLDISTFANILGITELNLDLRSIAEERNILREENLSKVLSRKRESGELNKDKLLVQAAINEFHTREELETSQPTQKIAVESKMLMIGLNNPTQILDLLGKNTAIDTFYDIDYSEENPNVISFNYDRISSELLQFIAEFDNPTLLLHRLNKLKINISTNDIMAQRDKAKEILTVMCQVSEEHFQKAVSDLNEFSCISSCSLLQGNMDDPNEDKILHRDFIARLRILKNGGLTDEEKKVLQTLDDDTVICPNIIDNYGLETVLDNKEFLKNMHIVLSEEILQTRDKNLSQKTIDKVIMLQEKGVLTKLSALLSAGITFSLERNYSHAHGVTNQTVMDNIVLENEFSESEDATKVIELIEIAYENLTNKEFILMRSFLGIFTIDNSGLVMDALELFQQTKTLIEALSPEEMKKIYKSLRSNKGFFASVPEVFDKTWEKWLLKYNRADLPYGTERIIDIMLGLLRSVLDFSVSNLSLAIKQNERRSVDSRVSENISKIEYSKEKKVKVGREEVEMFPIDTVRIDKDHVINQSMDIIQMSETQIRVQLFLTKNSQEKVLEVLNEYPDDIKIFNSEIEYSGKGIVDAVCYEPIEGLTISVASDPRVRSTVGLVDIFVDLSKIDKDVYIQEINSALSYLIGLGENESLLSPSDEESDKVLIQALYELNTKLVTPPSDVKFERRAVMDGYETVVIPGRSKALKDKFGSFVSYHTIYDSNYLLQILTNGIFSSHERYRRGMLIDGMSTNRDIESGGANSVFTRTFSVDSVINPDQVLKIFNSTNLIFDPQIWDRLDFYIYDRDCFGDTSDRHSKLRLSPDEYLSNLKSRKYERVDEQMFRRGISSEMIRGVMVVNTQEKNNIIKQLMDAGINSINGKSLDDFIYIISGTDDDVFVAVDIAEGKPIGTTKEIKRQEREKKLAQAAEPEQFSITEVLNKDLNTQQIIGAISNSDEYLKAKFQDDAFLSADYTNEEFVVLMGRQYDKYFYKKNAQDIFTDQEMRVGLSLHGIGRYEAFSKDHSLDNSDSTTREIAQDALQRVGFPDHKISLMLDMLTQDAIGSYVLFGDREDVLVSSATTIVEIAKKNDVSIKDMLNLLEVYFLCVASCSSIDATGKTSQMDIIGAFDFSVPGKIALSFEYQEKLQKLRNQVFEMV